MRVLRYVIVLLLAAAWTAPLYFVLVNAGSPVEEYSDKPPWALASSFELLQNMAAAWKTADLGSSLASTLLYAVVGSGTGVLIAASAAFAIIALRIRHGFAWFMLLYVGSVFPLQMFLAPLFIAYANTRLYDTRIGLLLLYIAIAIPFAVFIMRNHFSTIPGELSEAARIDGASSWTIFWRIYVPLSLNAAAAVFILQFTWIWNDLLFGLTLSRSSDVRPIMTALASLKGEYGTSSIPVVLAGALVVSVPTLALFLALQRLFVQGLTLTSGKE